MAKCGRRRAMMRTFATGLAAMSIVLGSCGGAQNETERRLRAAEPGTLVPLSSLFPPAVETVCLRGPYESLALQPSHKAEDALDEGSWAFVVTSKDGRRWHSVHRRSAALDVMTVPELRGDRPVGWGASVTTSCASRETGSAARFERNGRQYFTLMAPRD